MLPGTVAICLFAMQLNLEDRNGRWYNTDTEQKRFGQSACGICLLSEIQDDDFEGSTV